MRILIMLFIGFLSINPVLSKPKCVIIDGIEYCKKSQKVKIGDAEITIVDPEALFEAAKGNQVTKIKAHIWEDYRYPPFIEELARQNGMNAQELIDYLAPYDNNWKTLKDLEYVYSDVKSTYNGYEFDRAIEVVVNKIIDHVTNQIKRSV